MDTALVGSQCPMQTNVRIRTRDEKTGKIISERRAKNRVTKLALFGIVRFLNGEFNDTTPDRIYEYIPRYLAFGTNQASSTNNLGVGTTVTVNDTRLLSEIKTSTVSGMSVDRIFIAKRNHSKIESRFTDPFIKLTISCYIQSNIYDNIRISEAGLFTKSEGNNCWARVTFDPITKRSGEVIDVTWEITVLSYGSTVYPDSITFKNTNKITLGLRYTPYYIDGDKIMYLNKEVVDTPVCYDGDVNNQYMLKTALQSNSYYLMPEKSSSKPPYMIENGRIKKLSDDESQYESTDYYLYIGQYITDYNGNPYTEINDGQEIMYVIEDDYKLYTRQFITTEDPIDTKYRTKMSTMNGNEIMVIVDPKGNDTNNIISDKKIYTVSDHGTTSYTGYHISEDSFMCMGSSYKLTPVMTPSNITDKSITWVSGNDNIAEVNFDGVVTGMNLGTCRITAITSNSLKAVCNVEVKKYEEIVDTEDLLLKAIPPEGYLTWVKENIINFDSGSSIELDKELKNGKYDDYNGNLLLRGSGSSLICTKRDLTKPEFSGIHDATRYGLSSPDLNALELTFYSGSGRELVLYDKNNNINTSASDNSVMRLDADICLDGLRDANPDNTASIWFGCNIAKNNGTDVRNIKIIEFSNDESVSIKVLDGNVVDRHVTVKQWHHITIEFLLNIPYIRIYLDRKLIDTSMINTEDLYDEVHNSLRSIYITGSTTSEDNQLYKEMMYLDNIVISKDNNKFEEIDVTKDDGITLYLDDPTQQSATLVAYILPPYATNTAVKYYSDGSARDIVTLEPVGDNRAKISINGSGNIGRGIITCTSSNGLSRQCLVTVAYKSDEGGEC